MRAALLHSPRSITIEELPDPHPRRGWAKLRVLEVGICGTDKAIYLGTYRPGKLPLILGHEIAGIVEEIGEDEHEALVGKKVTTEINITCGKCWFCRNGMKTHCPYRRALGISENGGMADYVLTPVENLHVVEELTPLQASFVEPLAAAIQMTVMERPRGKNFLVLGAGAIGLLAAHVLRLYSPEILVVSAREDSPKAGLVKSMGFEFIPVNELEHFMKSETPEGQGFDYVVEATGAPEGLAIALKFVRPRGVIAAKSTHGIASELDYTSLVVKEVKLVGSRCGPFKTAIDLIKRGKIEVDRLVTSKFDLEDVKEAFEVSLQRDQVKVHVIP